MHAINRSHQVLTLAFVLAMVFQSAAMAANPVSRPVGFVRLTVAPGEEKLVSTPFYAFDNSINALLKDQLTGSSEENHADMILKWDNRIPEYLRAVKADNTGDPDRDGKWFMDLGSWRPSDMTISPGEGFIVCNRQATTQTVFLCGEMVLSESVDVSLNQGLSLIGVPFTGSGLLPGTEEGGDIIVDAAGHDVAGRMSTRGRGYWYFRGGADSLTWSISRPYADIFPADNAPPRVISMAPDEARDHVALTIAVFGGEIEKIDVFCQDLTDSCRFVSEKGWLLVGDEIQVGDADTITWIDILDNENNGPTARCYIVARADIDTDGDGVPDARERFVNGTDPLKRESLEGAERGASGLLSAMRKNVHDNASSLSGTNSISSPTPRRPIRITSRVVYVDKRIGSDRLPGRAPRVERGDGPKKTIRAGLEEAGSGEKIIVQPGQYSDDLDISGLAVSVEIQGEVTLRRQKNPPPRTRGNRNHRRRPNPPQRGHTPSASSVTNALNKVSLKNPGNR